MKTFYQRLDKAYLHFTKNIILARVKKSNFKLHKFDILARIWGYYVGLTIVIVFVGIPIANMIQGRKWWITLFMMVLWSFQVILALVKSREVIQKAVEYDFIFQNRKNPMLYEGMKKLCQQLFEQSKPFRITMVKWIFLLDIGFISLIVFMNALVGWQPSDITFLIILFQIPIWILDRYINYVFDFDEPPKKRKRKKEHLTNIAQKAWENLIKQPAFNPTIF